MAKATIQTIPTTEWGPNEFARAAQELRRREEEALYVYRPRPEQMPFHVSRASERLVRGGNRSGKTVCTAVEVASAALGMPLKAPDGQTIAHKYPTPPLVIWMIAFDERHIARMGRKLFKRGLFRCVKDPETGRTRIWGGYEVEPELEEQTFPSPPLIPDRMVRNWAWENKAKGVFSLCRLRNGTEIYAFPSGTEAAIGDFVHLIWVDEDVQNPGIIPELQARLADVRGRFIWSSWPRVSNPALFEMHNAAINPKEPEVEEINLRFDENPFLPPDEREKRVRRWKQLGEAVARARNLGEFVTDEFLVFPTFNINRHGYPRTEGPDRLESWFASRDWNIPPDWTWYLGVDPGHTHQAAIPLVIPPEMVGDYAIIPGEIYQSQSDADDLAEAISSRWPSVRWEAFAMDSHAGRQTSIGLSSTVAEHYEKAFDKFGIRSRQTGSHFLMGSDDIASRNMRIREWLTPREDGTTKLRLNRHDTLQLTKEFGLYKKRGVSPTDVQEEVIRRNNDCIDALAYIASVDPVWREIEPDDDWQDGDYAARMLRRFKNKPDPDSGYEFSFGAGAVGEYSATPV